VELSGTLVIPSITIRVPYWTPYKAQSLSQTVADWMTDIADILYDELPDLEIVYDPEEDPYVVTSDGSVLYD